MTYPKTIHQTSLVPYLIAESIVGNDEKAVTYLSKRAERIYENSLHFRNLINDTKRDCRETLRVYMQHWLMAYLKLN